jgi:hypothetical protein
LPPIPLFMLEKVRSAVATLGRRWLEREAELCWAAGLRDCPIILAPEGPVIDRPLQ